MTIDEETLAAMIAEDELGLLRLPVRSEGMTAEERLVASFAEVTDFVRQHEREPAKAAQDVAEMKLFFRLEAMRANADQREALAPHDEFGILTEPEPPESLEDALAGDALGLLAPPSDDIHDLRHVPTPSAAPEKVAQRRRCEDFEMFEPLFEMCHRELREGARKLVDFKNPQQIRPGRFFVQRGVLTYVAAEGERQKLPGGGSNARLRCIFENGTEADLLLLSLSSSLYQDGKQVTDPEEKTLAEVDQQLDGPSGFVYVLRSLSEDPDVGAIPDLHKIGFTTMSVARRTGGATKSATFLGAPVKEVLSLEMPRAMARGVESLLHQFFASARLDAWFERDGVTEAEVKEWFSVPLAVIEEAVDLIEAESIQSYQYDAEARQIVLRS